MNPAIAELDDRTAIYLLDTLSGNAFEPVRSGFEMDDNARQELRVKLALQPEPEPVGRGDLARAALQLLAGDPAIETRIITLAQYPPAQQFDLGLLGGAAVLTLALSVLQTEMKLSWDKKKGLQITLKKRAASDTVLRQFLAKLVNFKPGGS